MARQRADHQTLDLLTWEPPEIVERYDERTVRAASLRSRVARAVAATLRDTDIPRKEIAKAMSAWLGEDVSLHMLNAYASEAREEQTISFLRVLALIEITQDARLLQLGAEMFERMVIENRYLPWVEVGQLADKKVDIDRAFDAARRTARAKR